MDSDPHQAPPSNEPPAEGPEADQRSYAALALPVGIVTIATGSVLLGPRPQLALVVMGLGMFVTWFGKRATHHTLTQPLGLLFLLVGVVLLVLRVFVGSPTVMLQLAIAFLLPGVVLTPHGPRHGF